MRLVVEKGTTIAEALTRMYKFSASRLGEHDRLAEPLVVDFIPISEKGEPHPDLNHTFLLGAERFYDNDQERLAEAVSLTLKQMKDILSGRIKAAEEARLDLSAAFRKVSEAEKAKSPELKLLKRAYEKKRRKTGKIIENEEKHRAYLISLERFPQDVQWTTGIDFTDPKYGDRGRIGVCALFKADGDTVLYGNQAAGSSDFPNFMIVPEGYAPTEEDYVDARV